MGNTVFATWREDMPNIDGYRKIEKIDGVIYYMATSPSFAHGVVNNNINTSISKQLKGSLCRVCMENLDLKISDDEWLVPDIMIVCDKTKIKNGIYHGVPKFVVETLSPSTAKRDRQIKMKKYASIGVDEFWLINPKGESLEIYYLKDGNYALEESFILETYKEDDNYNANVVIKLRMFPQVSITLSDIFEDVDWAS